MINKITLFLTLCFGLTPISLKAEIKTCSSLSELEVFLGHWEEREENQVIKETWQKVSSSTFEGSGSNEEVSGNMLSSETLRLTEMSGEIFYFAKVRENEFPIAFKLTRCDQNSFEFNNPNHDFPKKIKYVFNGSGALTVEVGGDPEEHFTINFVKRGSEK